MSIVYLLLYYSTYLEITSILLARLANLESRERVLNWYKKWMREYSSQLPTVKGHEGGFAGIEYLLNRLYEIIGGREGALLHCVHL